MRRSSLVALLLDMRKADLATGGAGVEPRPPREPRTLPDPQPPRVVMPPRADPPREEPVGTPRPSPDEPRPRAEPNRDAAPYGVPDGVGSGGDGPSGVAGLGGESKEETHRRPALGGLLPQARQGFLPQVYHRKSQAYHRRTESKQDQAHGHGW